MNKKESIWSPKYEKWIWTIGVIICIIQYKLTGQIFYEIGVGTCLIMGRIAMMHEDLKKKDK